VQHRNLDTKYSEWDDEYYYTLEDKTADTIDHRERIEFLVEALGGREEPGGREAAAQSFLRLAARVQCYRKSLPLAAFLQVEALGMVCLISNFLSPTFLRKTKYKEIEEKTLSSVMSWYNIKMSIIYKKKFDEP
jgi:hypothetical protein